jgi:hypothetical protein
MKFHHVLVAHLAAFLGVLAPPAAHANIMGFGNFSGFTVNVDDTGSAPTVSSGTIRLTNAGTVNESRSIFFNTPQSIAGFTASFTYQESAGANGLDPGACFVLQNSTSGAGAVSTGDFGYAGLPGNSIGVTLELGGNASGYYTDGSYGGGSPSTSPVNLLSGDPINVTLTYNGSTLQESLLDTTTNASYSNSFLILTPIPTVLGGSTAYVGFTADSYGSSDFFGGDAVNQSFSNFQYTTSPVPEPSTFALLGVGAIGLLAWGWRRDGIRIIRIAR